jgi:hypothetical protein
MSIPHAARRRRHYSTRAHDRPVAGKRWEACSRSDDPAEHDRPPQALLSRLQPTERPVDELDGRSGREAPLQRSSGLPGPCAADLTCRYAGRPGWSGQALVEFALIAPVMILVLLGAAEMGMLYAARAAQDRSTAVVADWAADRPGEDWRLAADRELPGCDVHVTIDDGLGILTATATCTYHPRITSNLWDGLPISSEASAAISPEPTPSPAGSVAP